MTLKLLVAVIVLLGNWGNEAADLQMCIENFVVHADKIIRTQDSRALGAKYLTEADVPMKDDCLQMCCETPSCDVFVFEHKRGSCYLFHCGDPQDFKCKFTQHKNYSSGVLMPPTELEAQIKLTKHEDELAQLSKKADSPQASPPVAPQTTAQPATTAKPTALSKNVTGSSCSHYQFECRTSHECIAIYNACDGITQCPDGSDEGPELDCPSLTGTVHPRHPEHHQQLPVPNESHAISDAKKSQQTSQPFTPYSEKQAMEAQQELLNHVKNYGREGEGVAPPDTSAVYRAYADSRKPQEEQSRIFAHKGGLNTDGDSAAFNPYSGDQSSRAEYPRGGYYNGNPYPPYSNWPGRQRDDARWMYPGPPPPADYYYEESQMRRLPVPDRQPLPVNPPVVQVAATVPPPAQLVNPEKTTLTKVEEEKPKEKDTLSVKKVITETTVVPTLTTKAAPTHEKLEMNEDDFVVLEEDGEYEYPRGAVLSLALGMCIVAIMITLIGCRLRVAQRRLRRGGKAYAHDADFLVNGMYL